MANNDRLSLGVVTMTSTDLVEVNFTSVKNSLQFFENKKTDLICFPENSLYFNFQKNLDKSHALTLDNPLWSFLKTWASKHDCFLHMGGVPLREGSDVYNASVVIAPDQSLKVVYKKIHLFDVNVDGREVRESLSFAAGEGPAIIDVKGWKVGLSICYDLRFAELFVHYHRQEVDLILVPSSFLVPTGRSHWATLLRARAIETQAFVAAPAQVGIHHSELDSNLTARETWGESLVFDPWGRELSRAASFDELNAAKISPLYVELDRALIQKTRAQIPLRSHRKLQL